MGKKEEEGLDIEKEAKRQEGSYGHAWILKADETYGKTLKM